MRASTFHTNGDLDLATELLDVLAARDTVITAFVVGDWLTANPSWGPRLRDAGHEVANHTFTHPTFLTLPRDAMLDEIVRCRDVLARDAGSPGRFFRPSGTDDGTAAPPAVVLDVAAEAGYATVLGFDVDPFDYDDPGADAVVQRTLAAVRPGSIVSLHFGHPGTNAAMPALLDGLEERGLQPVTASKLLGIGRGAAEHIRDSGCPAGGGPRREQRGISPPVLHELRRAGRAPRSRRRRPPRLDRRARRC